MKSKVSRFIDGFSFVIIGFKTSKKIDGLFLLLLIPIALYFIMLFVFGAWGLSFISDYTQMALSFILSDKSTFYYKILYNTFYLLFYFAFLASGTYLLFILSTILASPINSLIAEKALVHFKLLDKRPFNFFLWLKTTLRMFFISIIRALILLTLGLVLFVFSFIPVLNIFTTFILFLIIAFDCMDYYFELKELGLRQRFASLKVLFPEYIGMSLFLWLAMLIPGFSLLILPYAIVGCSTILYKAKLRQTS
jgi:uncharacterized protein involved in cysteine biosynthesis